MEGKVYYAAEPSPDSEAPVESCWPAPDEWSYTSPERSTTSDGRCASQAPFKLSATAQPFVPFGYPASPPPVHNVDVHRSNGDGFGDSGLWVEKGCHAIALALTPPLPTRSVQRCK